MPRIGGAYLFSVRTGATRSRSRSTSRSLLSVSVPRSHDTGKSDGRVLIRLVPVVGPVVHLVGMTASRPSPPQGAVGAPVCLHGPPCPAKLCRMSNLDRAPVPSLCGGRGFVVAEPVRELLSPRRVQLGESTEVRRLLPNLGRRMVGAWCFVDHYGPDDIADEPGMQVPPASAHGPADRQLAARGRGAAPRQHWAACRRSARGSWA